MKMKAKVRFIPLVILGCISLLTYSCKEKEDDTPGPVPVINTFPVDSLKGTSAVCGGIIGDDGGSTITSRGVCWSTGTNPTISDSKTSDGAGAGTFKSKITGLSATTTYFVRAYATNGNGTGYGPAMSFTTINLAAGDPYQGGIIGYIFGPGDPGYVSGQTHGIIISPSDQSAGIQWYNGTNSTTGATSQNIGSGIVNTNTIIASQGAGSYAARLCYDLDLGGYNDWYLPSLEEMQSIFSRIDGDYRQFWTSSEYSATEAWWFDNNGTGYHFTKNQLLYVRAIRTF